MIKDVLIDLRNESHYTQDDMATLLQMSRTGYASWEQGLAEPKSADLKKLCVIFDISSDELLEICNPEQREMIRKEIPFNKLKKMRRSINV